MKDVKKYVYAAAGVILLGIIVFIGFISFQINGNKILKNTYVNSISIGNMTREEAKDVLNKKYDIKQIYISYSDKLWKINSKDIDLKYSLDETINEALSINREDSMIDNIKKTIKANFGAKNNLELKIDYNKEKLIKCVKDISKDINIDMEDAKLDINNSKVEVLSGHKGQEVDVNKSVENIISQLKKGNKKEDLAVKVTNQNVKKEDIQHIDTLLASYSTKFDSSVAGRTTNIKLAASRTSDKLLMPGEIFSYNENTLMRTVSNGYKNAPVIVQGVVQEGVGGGVCQVSSTLYNTVLYSGLEIVELKNHSIPSTYVAKGRDATVTDGGIDFVFKNNLKQPIYLKNYVSGNRVICQIYGSKSDKQNVDILTNIDGVSQAPIKRVDDPTLPKGKEKQLEKARNAYTVSTYRVYKNSNGEVLKKEKVYTSYYPKKQGVIAVGTMEVKTPEQKPVRPEKPNQQEQKPVQPEALTPPPEQNPNPDTPSVS